VAIHERIIARDPEDIGRRQRRCIGLATGNQLLWPRQGAFQQADVARPLAATVLGNLLKMNRDSQAGPHPAPFAGHRQARSP
jgi:hypothetical protein